MDRNDLYNISRFDWHDLFRVAWSFNADDERVRSLTSVGDFTGTMMAIILEHNVRELVEKAEETV